MAIINEARILWGFFLHVFRAIIRSSCDKIIQFTISILLVYS